MKILSVTVISLLFFAFVISGCKKDKEAAPGSTSYTRTQMLTAKPWKMTAMTVNPGIDMGGGLIITDIYSTFFASCDKDNLYKFSANGTYSFEEGATVCTTGDPQIYETGTWAFLNNETKMVTTPTTGVADTTTITSISLTTIVSTKTETTGGTTYTYTQTMTAQ